MILIKMVIYGTNWQFTFKRYDHYVIIFLYQKADVLNF